MERKQQRNVIGMIDGFGLDYLEGSDMPNLRNMMSGGLYRRVKGVFPSVTNVNNVSIACGGWPEEHGITGNSYFDDKTGETGYMNSADMIRMDTIFQRAARQGVQSALLTCKRKTVELLHKGTAISIAAEDPPGDYVDRYGSPGDIYSCEINHWLWRAAAGILKDRQDIGLLYVHTTDYPMHTWAPSEAESKEHLHLLDECIGLAVDAAPDTAFLISADHGMKYKTRCWDLTRICQEEGCPVRFVLSPEKDYYVKHHRNFTGCAWIWLNKPDDAERVTEIVSALEGVEGIVTKSEAADRFRLMPERIGDLTILGDENTMFGDLETRDEQLPPTYRAHGSLHEMDLPLIIYNSPGSVPAPEKFEFNNQLAGFLYR